MVALKKIVMENYPKMVTYGCGAHLANLLGDDIAESSTLAQIG